MGLISCNLRGVNQSLSPSDPLWPSETISSSPDSMNCALEMFIHLLLTLRGCWALALRQDESCPASSRGPEANLGVWVMLVGELEEGCCNCLPLPAWLQGQLVVMEARLENVPGEDWRPGYFPRPLIVMQHRVCVIWALALCSHWSPVCVLHLSFKQQVVVSRFRVDQM